MTQYSIDIWKMERGLPQNTVNSIIQDRVGYLWIATQDGLARFDGLNFKLYRFGENAVVPGNYIKTLFEDRMGALWVGTENGLSRIRNDRALFFTIREGLKSNRVIAITQSSDGLIWIGTDRGVSLIRQDRVVDDPILKNLPNTRVCSILEDKQKRIWLGTDSEGLYCLTNGDIRNIRNEDGLPSNTVYSLLEDSEGSIWIGGKGVLSVYRNQTISHYPIPNPKGKPANIMAILEDEPGILFLGTENGLFRFAGGQFDSLSVENGLPANSVYALCKDNEKSIWLGTIDGGLVCLKKEKFTVFTTQEGLSNNSINCVFWDIQNGLIVGHDLGIDRLIDHRIVPYSRFLKLPDISVLRIVADRENTVFFGTARGLFRMAPGKPIVPISELGGDAILSLWIDRKNRLWIGTKFRLYMQRGDILTRFSIQDGLPSDTIYTIRENEAGQIFAGTSRGLARLVDKERLSWKSWPDTRSVIVTEIYQDEAQNFWLGTTEGLKVILEDRLFSFTNNEGLETYYVETILDDGRGNLWVGTKGGIFAVTKRELIDCAMGKIRQAHPVLYTERDGLKSRFCNGPGAVTGKGDELRIWFPTINGLAMIEPGRIEGNPRIPPVHIEEMVIDGNTISDSEMKRMGKLRIPSGTKRIEFRYTALSFLHPEKVRFNYRLEGYDREWIGDNARRFATYTNIPPGDYTFRVIACNNDGVWNNQGATFSFRLMPYFWQRPLFLVLLSLFTLAAVFAFVSYRTRSLERRKQELETRVVEKTKELAEANEVLHDLNDRIIQANVDLESVNERLRSEIMERERAQFSLKESNEKLKELDQMKTEFLNMVSHELRTPLTSVVGFAKMIRKKQDEFIFPKIPEEDKKSERAIRQIKKDIDIIVSEGERLTSMINDLLDVAKLEAGKSPWKMDKIEVREIVHNAVAFTASLFDQKKLQRRIDIDENMLPVIGDRDRLIQVLINLLSNAVKFTNEGMVTCRARQVKDETSGRFFIEISVSDTGIGIAPEHHDKLFDKFVQVREGENAFMKGTGLGLSICKQIIENHGGRIWVKSKENRGSSFFFTLPTAS